MLPHVISRVWAARAARRACALAVTAVLGGCGLRGSGPLGEGAPAGFTEPSTGMEFLRVTGGTLVWGPPSGDARAPAGRPAEVSVPGFYLGRTEVTQAQWRTVMGSVPSWFRGDRRPVDQVSWDDAREFARRLSDRSGRRFRLPAEAEWEYAARSGGRDETWPGTADRATVGELAWFRENSGGGSREVRGLRPNGLGFHDMGGNVWEWCDDRYLPAGPGAPDDEHRVLRGGSWDDTLERVTATYRLRFVRSWVGRTVGFRLAADTR